MKITKSFLARAAAQSAQVVSPEPPENPVIRDVTPEPSPEPSVKPLEEQSVGELHQTIETVLPANVPTVRDERIMDMVKAEEERERIAGAVDEVIRLNKVRLDGEARNRVVSNVLHIRRTFHDIKEKYLELGKYLMRIYRDSRATYDILVSDEANILPFDAVTSLRLRKIAEAVDANRVPETILPSAWTAAYEVVTMDPDLLKRAIEERVVHPEAKRIPILEWKKKQEVRDETQTPARIRVLINKLETRKDKLRDDFERKMAEIDEELSILRSRIH